MSYKKAIKIFEDLPEEYKKLKRFDYNRGGGKCAIGVLVDVKPQHEGMGIGVLLENRRVISPIEGFSTKYIQNRLDELEMTNEEACELQDFVDVESNRIPLMIPEGRDLFDAALNFMKDRCADH